MAENNLSSGLSGLGKPKKSTQHYIQGIGLPKPRPKKPADSKDIVVPWPVKDAEIDISEVILKYTAKGIVAVKRTQKKKTSKPAKSEVLPIKEAGAIISDVEVRKKKRKRTGKNRKRYIITHCLSLHQLQQTEALEETSCSVCKEKKNMNRMRWCKKCIYYVCIVCCTGIEDSAFDCAKCRYNRGKTSEKFCRQCGGLLPTALRQSFDCKKCRSNRRRPTDKFCRKCGFEYEVKIPPDPQKKKKKSKKKKKAKEKKPFFSFQTTEGKEKMSEQIEEGSEVDLEVYYKSDFMFEELVTILKKQRTETTIYHLISQFSDNIGVEDLKEVLEKYVDLGLIEFVVKLEAPEGFRETFRLSTKYTLVDPVLPLKKSFEENDLEQVFWPLANSEGVWTLKTAPAPSKRPKELAHIIDSDRAIRNSMFLNPRSKRRRYGIEQWKSDGWVTGSTSEVGSMTEPQAASLNPVLNKPFNSGWTSTKVLPTGFEPKSNESVDPVLQRNSSSLGISRGLKHLRPLQQFPDQTPLQKNWRASQTHFSEYPTWHCENERPSHYGQTWYDGGYSQNGWPEGSQYDEGPPYVSTWNSGPPQEEVTDMRRLQALMRNSQRSY